MIRIATAECFTHGKIGREIHALAQSYEGNFGRDYIENPKEFGDFDYNDIGLVCGLFIPTIDAVKMVLQVENPPEPKTLIKGIKVYDEEEDKKVSKIMAGAVKNITDSDIAIGTTAGIGRGGICVLTDDYSIVTTTDVFSDLRENNSEELYNRQEDGIRKALRILLCLLNNDFRSIEDMDNVSIEKI
ncbi:MAG: UPF0254 family protein [Methanobrevibacter boviskoreani]|uniref:UPF0254 family protein n=1 Tax=Methanobrevibacter boviskoreani TaxID=1348249 RepID=UPI0023A8CA49|nr:UPF0254 family protein [Methanobrevibacter boviskoreani]MCI6775346.1 UPF0254 family protein [Methanobrevibacter boviskoreani]MDD6257231.1 UPF0254 family protein [Methanobrevibacter boviskoreani]MDY5614391.1 UPF0254 family protein [Methanobrevibacter boviskoreani]